ncbi:MAG TPA: CZB domain-containing protein [Bacteroidota bacterium]|nr:CZB domain-containing protein [Bacteroidota bacterium]
MISKEAIDTALSAHAQWKSRLQNAIDAGSSEFKADVVTRDNACQFGQWLYGLTGDDVKSDDYSKVKNLHTEFHKIAGEILALALSGKKDQALKMLGAGGPYGSATGKLVLALQAWKTKI